MVGGNPEPATATAFDTDKLFRLLLAELPPKKAAAVIAELTGETKRRFTNVLLRFRARPEPAGTGVSAAGVSFDHWSLHNQDNVCSGFVGTITNRVMKCSRSPLLKEEASCPVVNFTTTVSR